MHYLDFEKDLEQLDKNLNDLKNPFNEEGGLSSVNNNDIINLEGQIDSKITEIYSNLDGWKKTKIARHENRPKAHHYINVNLIISNIWPVIETLVKTRQQSQVLQKLMVILF